MKVNRFDRYILKASKTDEGYLVDTPIVGRIGIQLYRNPDGTLRRELRPETEVFNADSLNSFCGKPITDDHPSEPVTADNARSLTVGMMRDVAVRDGDDVRVPIIIHDARVVDKAYAGGKRELSLGYTVDLDETPGEWNGQPYDAVQRNIRVNHLALVKKGRAGNARLNLDRRDAVSYTPDEEGMTTENMGRVRLDSGLEYQAAPEVVVYVEKLRKDHDQHKTEITALQGRLDAMTAERDTFKATADSLPQVRIDALKQAREELVHRAALEKVAEQYKVDHANLTDRQLKEAVVKTVRADASFEGKSDEYVTAAYETTLAMKASDNMAQQRAAGQFKADGEGSAQPTGYAAYMASLTKKE